MKKEGAVVNTPRELTDGSDDVSSVGIPRRYYQELGDRYMRRYPSCLNRAKSFLPWLFKKTAP